MTSQKLSVQVAINSWRLVVERANKIFSNRTEDEFLKKVAPGKNRLIYLLGHLTAIQQLPAAAELRKYWDEGNGKLLAQFATLSADEWLQRHYAMSEEDYAKDPTRNRLAVLLSRANHLSYHLGQIALAVK